MNQEEKIRFRCPKCGRGLRLSAEYAGRKGKCKCGAVIKIPLQSISDHTSTGGANNTKTNLEHKQKYCKSCGKALREVRKNGIPTGKYVCLKCFGKPGICPICQGKLRTPMAQQCPNCYCAWHEIVAESAKSEPSSSPAVPTSKKPELSPPSEPPADGTEPYIEVLLDEKVLRFDTLEKIRDELLSGNITRHHQSRWIEPQPELSDSDDVSSHRKAVEAWKIRFQWRAIGDGLAYEEGELSLIHI